MIRVILLLAAWALTSNLVKAAESDPLFQSTDALEITLRGPFRQIDRERDKEKEYDGTLSYTTAAGQAQTLDLAYEVRGNWRLRKDVCRYSQLWLDLKRGQVPETLFENQNRLKLVVQCRQGDRYGDLIIKEYLAYQFFSRLVEPDFATRLVRVNYEYSDDEGESRTHLGLLIENRRTVADRFNMETVELTGVNLATLEPLQSSLVSMFMYMIGNTDFSIAAGPEGDECCHNTKLLESAGQNIPIPYDFDSSGFVNASYAADPDPSFRIRNNRRRLYRGYCIHNDYVADAISQFQDARNDILAIANDPRLSSERAANTAIRYLEQFYEIIGDPEEIQDEILDDCRG